MYGFGFAPFFILVWGIACGLQFVLAVDGKCPWYVFIISIIAAIGYTTLTTVNLCRKLKRDYNLIYRTNEPTAREILTQDSSPKDLEKE